MMTDSTVLCTEIDMGYSEQYCSRGNIWGCILLPYTSFLLFIHLWCYFSLFFFCQSLFFITVFKLQSHLYTTRSNDLLSRSTTKFFFMTSYFTLPHKTVIRSSEEWITVEFKMVMMIINFVVLWWCKKSHFSSSKMTSKKLDESPKYIKIEGIVLEGSFRRIMSVRGNYFSQLFQYYIIRSLKPYGYGCMV